MSPPNKTSWVTLLLDTLLSLLLRFPIMSSFIQKFAQKADNFAEARAPLNTDGAKPEGGVYEREAAELHALIAKPVFSLSEVVSTWAADVDRSGLNVFACSLPS